MGKETTMTVKIGGKTKFVVVCTVLDVIPDKFPGMGGKVVVELTDIGAEFVQGEIQYVMKLLAERGMIHDSEYKFDLHFSELLGGSTEAVGCFVESVSYTFDDTVECKFSVDKFSVDKLSDMSWRSI